VTLLARVHGVLEELGLPHALIGAAALAVHGVSRSTLDLDLLVTDARALEASTWHVLEAGGARVEIRLGDADDPLVGVIRIEHGDERPVDVVVARGTWQDEILRRASATRVADADVPVATAPDVVLLKLYAGGAQDRWDVGQLLAGSDRDAIVAAVDTRIVQLPARCHALWNDIRSA